MTVAPSLRSGRVVACPSPHSVVILVEGRSQALTSSVALTLTPGDLVSLRLDGERVVEATLVHRPAVDVFARGRETHRFSVEPVARLLQQRMAITDAVRGYLRCEGFLEVDTPAVVINPGMDAHLASYRVEGLGWLITSPEYHLKRLLAGGVPRCAQFARCWREGELGQRHQPEFTMLEFYRAWEGLDRVLDDTEAMVCLAVEAVTGDASTVMRGTHAVSLARPFARMTVREAFARWAPEVGDPIDLAERDEATYYEVFSTRVEPHLGRDHATFLTGFASVQASLARVSPNDARTCLRAELYVDGIELCNAFDELTDAREQRARFVHDQTVRTTLGRPVYPLDEAFLSALEEGMPPSAGNAVGFDRLVMLATGAASLDAVIAFPHTASR